MTSCLRRSASGKSHGRLQGWRVITCLAPILVGSLIHSSLKAKSKERKEINRDASRCTIAAATINNLCVYFDAVLMPREFFWGLRRTGSNERPEFRNASGVISDYPKYIEVNLSASESPCPANPQSESLSPISLLHAEIFQSIGLENIWEEGDRSREAEVKEPMSTQPRWTEPLKKFGIESGLWVWQYRIHSEGVPLTNRLKIEIYFKDGDKVASLSCGP